MDIKKHKGSVEKVGCVIEQSGRPCLMNNRHDRYNLGK